MPHLARTNEDVAHIDGANHLALGENPTRCGRDVVLEDADMAAGDFVRWAKQTIDLLDQLSIVAPSPETARTARSALDSVRRGIVAYSSM